MRKFFCILMLAAFIGCRLFAQKALLITTTATERWKIKSLKLDKVMKVQKGDTIFVYPDSTLQEVSGFGGTFNELGWDALQYLTLIEREQVMKSLFSSSGANFSWGRTPVGASDYAIGYYSYDDVKEDYTMRDFSIARDRYILIPYIKAVLKIRPDLKLWASPWTPPAWMKVNEHYSQKSQGINGTDVGHNRLDPNKNVLGNVTGFKMQEGYLKAYALYLSKYIQYYQQQGIKIDVLMPQNEIAWTPAWPSCTWRPEDLGLFVGQYLGPQFKKDSLQTQLWLGTINYPNPDYVRTFLKQKDVDKYIKGIGVQWSGKQALPVIHKEYPNYRYMQTENQCGNGENDWSSLEETWKSVVYCFNNGVNSYMYWNMVLDETCKSSWDWKQNCLIIIDRKNKKIRYTDEYYLMKHLSRYVQPGSHLVKVSDSKNTLAFKTFDGELVVVIYNNNPTKHYYLSLGQKSLSIELAEKSINTIYISR